MDKNRFTIAELEKQCEEAQKNFELLSKQLEKQKREEEEKKMAELVAQKAARKKEVDTAYDTFLELRRAYMNDYGHYFYDTTNSAGDSFLTWWLS